MHLKAFFVCLSGLLVVMTQASSHGNDPAQGTSVPPNQGPEHSSWGKVRNTIQAFNPQQKESYLNNFKLIFGDSHVVEGKDLETVLQLCYIAENPAAEGPMATELKRLKDQRAAAAAQHPGPSTGVAKKEVKKEEP